MEHNDLGDDEKEYIQERLITYILKNAKHWAEKRETFFECSAEEIMKLRLPLNSEFDDSIRDSDFRVVWMRFYDKVGNEISKSFDLQCYCMRLWEKGPYWESVIGYNKHQKPY